MKRRVYSCYYYYYLLCIKHQAPTPVPAPQESCCIFSGSSTAVHDLPGNSGFGHELYVTAIIRSLFSWQQCHSNSLHAHFVPNIMISNRISSCYCNHSPPEHLGNLPLEVTAKRVTLHCCCPLFVRFPFAVPHM
jgi:hypothetical protein